MTEHKLNIIETEWGVELEIPDGTKLEEDNVLNSMKELIERLNSINKKRILVDRTKIVIPKSVLALLEEVELFQKIGGTGFRVAFFTLHDIDNDNTKFAENVGHNRGVFVKYFYTKNEAINWLIS